MPSSPSSSDRVTTVGELRELVGVFVEEREWGVFHTPKNLAMSLAIEAAELMEHFQWLTPEEAQSAVKDPAKLREIGEELADVLCYALALGNTLSLDLSQAVRDKMAKNRARYPAAEFRGRYGADDPRPTTRAAVKRTSAPGKPANKATTRRKR